MGECRQQKHTQHAPSTKTECDYLSGWIKKRSHTQKSHPKVVNPRDIAGERKKKKKKKKSRCCMDLAVRAAVCVVWCGTGHEELKKEKNFKEKNQLTQYRTNHWPPVACLRHPQLGCRPGNNDNLSLAVLA